MTKGLNQYPMVTNAHAVGEYSKCILKMIDRKVYIRQAQAYLFGELVNACHSNAVCSRRGVKSKDTINTSVMPGWIDGVLDGKEYRRSKDKRRLTDRLQYIIYEIDYVIGKKLYI